MKFPDFFEFYTRPNLARNLLKSKSRWQIFWKFWPEISNEFFFQKWPFWDKNELFMTWICRFNSKLVIFGRKFAISKVKWDNFGQKWPFLPPLSFLTIFCQIATYRKPQRNVFSREITIFTKITKFQKCKKTCGNSEKSD